MTGSQIEQRSLELFFEDYCIESKDRSISRGFLDGIKLLIVYAGQSSDLAQAAKIVALAGVGLRTGRKDLISRTKKKYGILLASFQSNLCAKLGVNSVESLMTAVLLGLYEVSKRSINRLELNL